MVYLLGNYTLRNETYDIFANKSENLTGEHESPTKSHEGGLLSGNGPLHTPLGRFLIQVTRFHLRPFTVALYSINYFRLLSLLQSVNFCTFFCKN